MKVHISSTSDSCCGIPSQGDAGIAALRTELPAVASFTDVAAFLAMAANPVRLQLLFALRLREELCVCDMAALIGMSTAAVSAHLQKLKLAGILRTRREGQMIFYSLVRTTHVEVLESFFAESMSPG